MKNTLGFALVLCFLIGLGAPPATWADPPNWIIREEGATPYHEYALVNNCGGWTACQSTAEGYGGNLVMLEDGAEAIWVIDTFGTTGINTATRARDFNIGLSCPITPCDHSDPETVWTWEATGETPDDYGYTNWRDYQTGAGDGCYARMGHTVIFLGGTRWDWRRGSDSTGGAYTYDEDGVIEREACTDTDEDTYYDQAYCPSVLLQDCAPSDPSVNPGAVEDCENRKDDDCDGLIDMADGDCFCVDNDGDGFGQYNRENCEKPGWDCNDNIAAINPWAPEILGNMIDDNCDGSACFITTAGF